MDEQERRAVDEACLRLLGWTQEDIARPSCFAVPSVSQRPDLVVPLWNALLARGWRIHIDGSGSQICLVSMVHDDHDRVVAVADTLPEAFATAAARVVGKEPCS
jgi:hypothetical protein